MEALVEPVQTKKYYESRGTTNLVRFLSFKILHIQSVAVSQIITA